MTNILYADVWHNSIGKKWKLTLAIRVENNIIVSAAHGGSFFYGRKNTNKEVLKEALKSFTLFNPDKHLDEDDPEYQQEMKDFQVEFIDRPKMNELINELPIDPKVKDFIESLY